MTFLQGPEYYPTYLLLMLLLIICKSIKKGELIYFQKRNYTITGCVLLSLFFIIFFGFRPHDRWFPDTIVYAGSYEHAKYDVTADSKGEYLFDFIRDTCASLNLSVEAYFCVVCALYMGLLIVACKVLFKQNSYLAFLFVCTAFTFYNGAGAIIRNGLSSNAFLAAIAILCSNMKHKNVYAILLLIASYYTHNSAAISICALVFSLYIIKSTRTTMLLWAAAIVVALLFGSSIGTHISEYIDNDRLDYYVEAGLDPEAFEGFSHSGFRWDFVFYSFTGIFMIWYVTIKHKIKDRAYTIIANTYILSNMMWILLIYVQFSDRLARLSWVLLPFVFLYPLVKFKLWRKPGEVASLILYGQWIFLLVMSFSSIKNFFLS